MNVTHRCFAMVLQVGKNDDECCLSSFCYGLASKKKQQWTLFVIIVLWCFRNKWMTTNNWATRHCSTLVLQQQNNDNELHNYLLSFCYGLTSEKKQQMWSWHYFVSTKNYFWLANWFFILLHFYKKMCDVCVFVKWKFERKQRMVKQMAWEVSWMKEIWRQG